MVPEISLVWTGWKYHQTTRRSFAGIPRRTFLGFFPPLPGPGPLLLVWTPGIPVGKREKTFGRAQRSMAYPTHAHARSRPCHVAQR